jgi:hypothetical protein
MGAVLRGLGVDTLFINPVVPGEMAIANTSMVKYGTNCWPVKLFA